MCARVRQELERHTELCCVWNTVLIFFLCSWDTLAGGGGGGPGKGTLGQGLPLWLWVGERREHTS